MTATAPLSMYTASVPVFQQMLGALTGILDKVEAHAVARKIDPAVMLGLRLAPDMFPVSRQIQISCDFAKGTVARLAGVDNPNYADTETTIEQLKERIAKTLAFINSIPASAIEGSEGRDVTFKAGPVEMQFKGQPYLVGFALPNFYFHVTTAYAILRANGLDVGKFDYMGMKRPTA
jgi:uncharacterized protein